MILFNVFKGFLYLIPMLKILFVGVISVVVIFLQNLLLGRPIEISVGNNLYGNITGSEN